MRFLIYFLFFICLCFVSADILAEQDGQKELYSNVQEIATSLVLKNDSELIKAKKLAEFVATHFERDGFYEKEKLKAAKKNKVYEKPYKNDLFQTKVGDSIAFAQLYKQLCEAVGLNAVVVEGYAGKNIKAYNVVRHEQKAIKQAFEMVTGKIDSSLERYHSAWNVVQVNGKWILVDTYWMIKGEKSAYKSVSSVRQMEKILKQNQSKKLKRKNTAIDKRFFNIKPKEMIKTHFPYDEKWQLLPHPISLNEFVKN